MQVRRARPPSCLTGYPTQPDPSYGIGNGRVDGITQPFDDLIDDRCIENKRRRD
jgi:hypothetical protein